MDSPTGLITAARGVHVVAHRNRLRRSLFSSLPPKLPIDVASTTFSVNALDNSGKTGWLVVSGNYASRIDYASS
jgi:hypothetical protein